ncbi:PRA1 family protein F3-like [Macadamia integrifolia]|uniref:PRA1 family protein F3-like n=1 Tax=Macadamia integrifolia TaxID=60698 RepID=UPI001C4F1F0A|nr:PRA1 family protein F3-like [Macadamia integrifolia]
MTTTYGTIPSESLGTSRGEFISRAKERIKSGLGPARQWREMLHRHAVGVPTSAGDAFSRARTNFGYFRMNYAIIVLLIVFLSLLWHPISLIVFVVMMAIWLYLYFLRDEPWVIFGRTIDDRVVLVLLSIFTLIALFLTRATLNIVVSLLIGLVVILIHSVFRKTDDLFQDEEAMSSGGDGVTRPLTEPSSSS